MGESNELAKKVVKILDSVPKMDFQMGGLRISKDGLGDVAYAIQKGVIKVERDASLSTDAEYDSAEDTLGLKSLKFDDVEFKSLIVHEAVHALIDLLKAKDTRRLTGEAAAYLVQAIHLRHELTDATFRAIVTQQAKSANEREKQLGRIYKACLELIDKCKLPSRDARIPPILYQPILEAIKGHDVYKYIPWDQKAKADGIRARGAQAALYVQEGGLRIAHARAGGPVGVRDMGNPFGHGSSRNPGPAGIA
ncbi:MAG: hypothetical protein JW955_15520 [Sedimentisphaerales bacterium]|nr:hypothetical protein [Sedimentisphaerales bacterium]